ncbi:hypothetical protein V1525DRAFT_401915 [Lipomyces kononenkoae]|uniref:Uncharacterized protein n=1 Tax=Lipomyces kononenkoae TaxID=34357 RepID=A0ACC3T2W9_LIPKO
MIPHVITATGHAVSLLCDDQQQQPAVAISLTTASSESLRQLPRIPEPTPPLSPSSLAISAESAPSSSSMNPNHQHLATLSSYHKPPIPPYSGQHSSVQRQLELVGTSSSSYPESAYPYRRPASDNYFTADGQYNNSYTYASPPPPPPPPSNQSQYPWYAPAQEPQAPRQDQDQSGYNVIRSPPLADQHQYYQPSTVPFQPARSASPLPPVNSTIASGPSMPTPPTAAPSPRRRSRGSKTSPSPSSPATTTTTTTTAAAAAGAAGEQARKTRRYTCHCGKSFTTSGHLARHMRIHTGEKNYVCPEKGCGARFSRQDNCMQHYRTHQTQCTKRNNSLGSSSASGTIRPGVPGVASSNTSAIQAARKRRSSHPGVLEGGGSNSGRMTSRQAAAAATVKHETNKTHQHRHSADFTPTTADYVRHQSQSYHDPRFTAAAGSPPRLLPLPSPQQAPYQPQYSPHSQYSPLPPAAVQLQPYESSQHYHPVARLQQQPQDLQYQGPPAALPAPSSLRVPVMQTSPSSSVDPASDAISRLDELASIATQVAV